MRRQPTPRAILAVVAFGVFVAADDLTVVSTMLRPIIGDLGVALPDGLDDAAWVVNAYLIAYVGVMPFMGRLSDIIGRRAVFMGALSLFLAGSLAVPLAPSLSWFLAARVVTALGGGAMVPVAMAVVGDVYREPRRATALGTLAAVDTMGWVWGPLYGAMLVRFLSWQWQFYLNVPLALAGMAATWWALQDHATPARRARIDWAGAVTLATAMVAVNVALLGSARIQTVTGLEELTGGRAPTMWLYPVALVAGAAFVTIQRRSDDPLIDLALFRGRNLSVAVVVNFLVGAVLVIAMVDVPLFVNVVEVDVERSAVVAGWVLSALTVAMAFAAYAGGRITEARSYRPATIVGLALATTGFLVMGSTWEVATPYPQMAAQLALLGIGFGLVTAPTAAAVVDAAPSERRGTAAGLIQVFRLMGLSVGLSGLTAWGLHRFNVLPATVQLPPPDAPGYQDALAEAQARLTTSALAETFLAAALVTALGLGVALLLRRHPATSGDEPHDSSHDADLPAG